MGSSLNQRAAEFSLCNTPVLLTDLAFKQHIRNQGRRLCEREACDSSTV